MSTAEPRPGCPARRHGDASAYACYKCRCPDAREAWRLYRKRTREGRIQPAHVDSIGTARRLQALAAIGWSLDELTMYLGWPKGSVQNRRTARWPTVTRATADRVARVYDELSMTPGPSSRARDLAVRRGWSPPLAWNDDEIDDPAAKPAVGTRRWTCAPNETVIAAVLAGDVDARRQLKGPDRQELVRRLHAQGLNDVQIIERTGLSRRLVQYLRSRLCLPSNDPRDVRARAGVRSLHNEQEVA